MAGKFLYIGDAKLWVKGVTYGTFRPDASGEEFHDPAVVERDFADIAATGLNAVRTYTVPPRWVLDAARRHGLRVMVCLPWEQHVTFLDDPERARAIEEGIRMGVRACAGHPAVLCYAVGSEIPASIVRWHGRHRVERHIWRLYRAAKAEDPEGLVTYVNYPTTEYLQLPFLDLVCFNVYLESPECLDAYLARLHNLTGDRPLIMAEIGMDSRRHGVDEQALVLDWQIRTTFAAGCAGVFVFAWTDEWHRGGYDIDDWEFGLTDRARRPKPALGVVCQALGDIPFQRSLLWPRISVVICTLNGARTIRDCFEGLRRLEYPDFEVIVVNDGSSDGTDVIAREYGFRLISTENMGLSSARNTGLAAATGEIIAYLDDDAWPDPHWLHYLAVTFMRQDVVAVGGPNIAPQGDGHVAECVAHAPGGPIHVLLSDREAEHIPGCNMAFRKEALRAIGGFDPRFRTAGDDVDVCWRLRERGWKLGIHPAAMVWHHSRSSLRAYWKQQEGYGRAEALLERKWPHKYNAAGHYAWTGRLYGNRLTESLRIRPGRIYHGTWGNALFQSVYQPAPGTLATLPLMPEWYLVIAGLATLSLLGAMWAPLLWTVPLLAYAIGAPLLLAVLGAARASFTGVARSRMTLLRLRFLTALLHLIQPLARLSGRLRNGLTPWRGRGGHGRLVFPRPRRSSVWSEHWRAPTQWLRSVEAALLAACVPFRRGGDYDSWDLEVRGGLLGVVRVRMGIEEHGAGRQLARFRLWPRVSLPGLVPPILLTILSVAAALDRSSATSAVLGVTALLCLLGTVWQCGIAMGALVRALSEVRSGEA